MEKILIKKITEIIENMTTHEQYCFYSEYCDSNNLYDDRPEMIDNIDDSFCDLKPLEILEKLKGMDLSWKYFNFDGYGNIQKWDGIENIPEVVQAIVDSENSFENYDIQEILNTFSDLEELVNNAMEEVYGKLCTQVVEEMENNTDTKGENLFFNYEKEIKKYIGGYIFDC